MKYVLALSALAALASAVPQQQPSATAAVEKLPWYESTGEICAGFDEQCMGTDSFCDFTAEHKKFADRRACLAAHERPVYKEPQADRTPEEQAARDGNQAAVEKQVKELCRNMRWGWGCGNPGPNCVRNEKNLGKETDVQKRVDAVEVCLREAFGADAF
ncbi:hypothetical protein AAL_00513 [Moelleriella libera RCEF 2490]|uniref:Uncharacterized protein n=1 Tax=Moelleriella libera RCEF 2490 TaxID=1081109 RepID=A0A166UWV1_9HYPO|nr:hypothetical protein AAL_00513 [Moelleriella libera RCEF 2490]